MRSLAVHALATLTPAVLLGQVVGYRTIALTGQSAPGTTGTFGDVFRVPAINNAGDVAFVASLNGVPGSAKGVWVRRGGALELVARVGQPAPGAAGTIIDFPNPEVVILNDAGDVAFACTTSTGAAICARRAGVLGLVAGVGQAAPGLGATTYSTLHSTVMAMNASGHVAFYATLSGIADRESLWVDAGAGPALRVRQGDAAPITGDYTFQFVLPTTLPSLSLTDAGRVGLWAQVRSATQQRSDQSVWISDPGGLQLVIKRDDAMPELPTATYRDTLMPLAFNASGRGAMAASFAGNGFGDNPQVVYSWNPGAFENLARTEVVALGGGAEFSYFGGAFVNAADQVLFAAGLEDGDATGANNIALFRDDNAGTVGATTVYRLGDPAPGVPGFEHGAGTSTVPSLKRPYSINAHGQVVFYTPLRPAGQAQNSADGLWVTGIDAMPALVVRSGTSFDVDPGPGEDLRTVVSGVLFPQGDGSGGEDGRPRVLNDRGEVVFRLRFSNNTEGVFVASSRCPADLDDGTGTGAPDGGVTIDDLVYFLAVFDVGGVGADVDDGSGSGQPDGGVTIDDLIFYLDRFDLGC